MGFDVIDEGGRHLNRVPIPDVDGIAGMHITIVVSCEFMIDFIMNRIEYFKCAVLNTLTNATTVRVLVKAHLYASESP